MPLRFNERESAISGNVLLIVLLAISLVCVVVYGAEGEGGPLHRVQGAVGVAATPLKTAGAGIVAAETSAQTALEDLNADPNTISELKEQNEQLRQMVSELEEYRQTAERLQGIQKLKDTYSIEGLTCRIIGVTGDSWNRVVTIDKGADDGIAVGLPVMGSSGLVGQVKSVTGTTADVRLLQDPSSGVAVMIQSSRAEGLVKGNIDGLLYLEDVANDVDVKVGDVIVTSGLGGGYFRGLIVGTVVRIEHGSGQAVRQIVVAPNDSASALEEVMVVTGISSEGALAEGAASSDANTAGDSASGDSAQGQDADSDDSGSYDADADDGGYDDGAGDESNDDGYEGE